MPLDQDTLDKLAEAGKITPETADMARGGETMAPRRMASRGGDEVEKALIETAKAGAMPGYEVVAKLGGMYPGEVVERGGRQFFEPEYGPVAGGLIAIEPGANIGDVQEFAAGPPGSETRRPDPATPTAQAAPGGITPRQQRLADVLVNRGM